MNEKNPFVFVVDDDASMRDSLKHLIGSAGLAVQTFASAQEFLTSQRPDGAACLVLDVQLPGLSGLDLQQELAKVDVQIPIIFITGHGDIPTTFKAMKAGAIEFLTKPFRGEDLLNAVEQAIKRSREIEQLGNHPAEAKPYFEDDLRSQVGFSGFVEQSAALRRVPKDVETVARTDSTVLIHGETGTGKELIASAKAKSDVPLEASFLDDAVPLESILLTEELYRRPSRPPDYGKENSALAALVCALADSPHTILQTLAEKVLDVLQADSAGLSLLTKDKKRFYWPAIAGAWQPHIGGGTPRNSGPCGDVLDRNIPMLFTHWEWRYPYLRQAAPLAQEGLLVPFYVNGKAVGTIWAIAHTNHRKFDAEDLRLLESLGRFASPAYQTLASIDDLQFQIAAREKAETAVLKLATGLEAKVRRLVEANIIGIVIWNVEGRILEANDAFLRMVGYGREDLVSGRVSWREVTPDKWRAADERALAELAATGVCEPFEKEYFRKDGSRVPVLVGAALLEGSGKEGVAFVLELTERKRAEEALRESEKRYERVMLAAEAGFWDWDVPADKFYVSPKLLEMTDFAPGTKFAGQADFMTRAPFHPDDWTKWERAVKELFASGGTRLAMEIRSIHGNETRWAFLSGMCVRDASGKILRWTGSATDITARKRADEALRASEARFRSLTELSSDWYWEQDENLRFTYLSAQANDLTGYSGASSLGKTRWELANMTPLSCTWEEHKAVLAARRPFRDLECRRVGPNGRVRYLSMSGAPIFDGQGVFRGYQGIGRDITERKRAEAKRLKLEERLRQAEKMEAIGRLAGGIAHDFNNVLGGIFAFGEMLYEEAPESSSRKRHARNLLTAATRGRALVEQILAYSRSQGGKREPTNIGRMVAETLELVRGSLPPNITVESRAAGLSLVVMSNATQLHQLIMNLCSNAIHALGKGGALRVALAASDVSAEHTLSHGRLTPGRYACLTVEDSGCGMEAATLAHIFEPFYTTKEVGRGTGLGLSIVYGIVTDLGGAIDVKSAPAQGSTFAIYLPLAAELPVAAAA